ncbi:hypothetical protein ZIOFF_025169 [Zingiber officinale]|uniref:non-specific serine/threonine protein kinase n=1 Tax=Zingiber officinale TaxID=94328 RepID=A0A8J5H178_ZINOF|nr:hypothetical protein ZIOFF_025169 [Zingiber officinale]
MASFNFTSDGNLILFEEDRNVWSTETRSTGLNSARLQLLDSGNLVLNDSNSILWQSFEDSNDSDTYLPGMKLGYDNRANTSWRQVSWKNSMDPSPGDYIQMIRSLPIPDLVTLKGSAKYHRFGLWNVNRQWSLSGSTPDDVPESRSVSFDSEDSRDLHNTDKGVGMLNTLGLLPSYDLCTIKNATNNFSDGNKLGEGGFGVVYKGQLEDAQTIAVKKLSKNSSQGPSEFQNELSLIAKLQHRNLVRLLGCCIEGAERLIVLEYMENKSLDAFIYDKIKSSLLNWQKRLDIIIGIARGLLYLHQDSILRVIHRDLKPSYILLDRDMSPTISDFGIARIVEGDRDLADGTTRPIGTL